MKYYLVTGELSSVHQPFSNIWYDMIWYDMIFYSILFYRVSQKSTEFFTAVVKLWNQIYEQIVFRLIKKL